MLKAIVAIDSFKGSMTSLEAGDAVRTGILRADPKAQVVVRPLADGGEGTVEALTIGMGGTFEHVTVTGPMGEPADACYGILPDGITAVMEMSQASGITLVRPQDLNPLRATTYGVGEMILAAIQKGCRKFIFGIGGSATNDGGVGMLQALGFGMLDQDGVPVPQGAQGLEKLRIITTDQVVPALSQCSFRIACDVTNPLCGEQGCSAVFGPQKGADPSMILQMDAWLKHYAELAGSVSDRADAKMPGTGAAGGLGFAFLSFTNAVLESGIHIVLEETHLADYVKDADVVVTGEGRLDAQSVMGKAPVGVADIAKRYGKLTIALSGSVTPDARVCNAHGIDAYFPILRQVCSLQEAMDTGNAKQNLSDTAEQIFRLIGAVKK